MLAAATVLLSSYALADQPYQPDPQTLMQCQQIANMTPTDIFANTQQGVQQSYDQTAQNCFKQSMCSYMSSVDKVSCARALALNSYLIDVAYQTHGPAYPPYPQNSTQTSVIPFTPATSPAVAVTAPATSEAVTQQQAPDSYNNLAAPIITNVTPSTTNTTKNTINWS